MICSRNELINIVLYFILAAAITFHALSGAGVEVYLSGDRGDTSHQEAVVVNYYFPSCSSPWAKSHLHRVSILVVYRVNAILLLPTMIVIIVVIINNVVVVVVLVYLFVIV